MTTLTVWISCTTPPVRTGFFDVHAVADVDSSLPPLSAEFKNGQFYGVLENGERYLMGAVHRNPDRWLWRGRRMWVLQAGTAFVAHVSRRGVVYLTDRLVQPVSASFKYAHALVFETEQEAEVYLLKHSKRLKGCKAVQP